MNPADPRWLEILKATGWQNFGLSLAFATFIYLVKTKSISVTDSTLWVAIPAIISLVCGGLALAAFGNAITKFTNNRISRYFSRRKYRKMVEKCIPHMTEKDREIIGYLLHHNHKTFQTTSDGGYAAPLIGKRIIRVAAVQGQVLDGNWFPFEVVDDAWDVLLKFRENFPYQPPRSEIETHPWAIPWMVR